jgi:hypothetical protein
MSSYANTSARKALNAAVKERNTFAALPFPKNVDDMFEHIDRYEVLETKCQLLEKEVYGAAWWGLTAGSDNSTDTQITATQK